MYVFNSDIQGGLPVNFTAQTALPTNSTGPITINGVTAAVGAGTANFRVTVLNNSTFPTGVELDMHAWLQDVVATTVGNNYVNAGGAVVSPADVYTGVLETNDGMQLFLETNEVGGSGNLGCIGVFIEVFHSGSWVPLLSLAGVTYVDNYGNNALSHDGAGDLPYYTISLGGPPPPGGFWTALANCLQA